MWCGELRNGKQELRITTVVKDNNWFGRVYFFVIRPFHGHLGTTKRLDCSRRLKLMDFFLSVGKHN